MKNQIAIREAITEADIAVFWGQLHTYHMRDIGGREMLHFGVLRFPGVPG